jgi:hypothetical protein
MKSDEELIDIARTAVPDHLKPLGRIVGHATEPAERATASGPGAAAAENDDDLMESLAAEVGTTLGEDADDSADVEFVEHTKLGARSTIVQVRNGEVARVLKRA